ncbi:MAG: hypothetical protein UW69_C0056G0008 [Microgenomates group bacterium GW2011_GWA2_44_7]|nr:MAG: hypothetical protein UW69_C0056G0008 [Microgenomates group bacterium GW2011_GWA2_44_7]
MPDYGLNWDEPFHYLKGQAYTRYLLTGKKEYEQASRISPVLIKRGEYISRYEIGAWEGVKQLVQLPENPKPQMEFREIQRRGGSRQSFYEHESWDGTNFFELEKEDPGHPSFMDIMAALSNKVGYQLLGFAGDIESYKIPSILVSAFGVFLVSLFAFEVTGSKFGSLVAGLAMGSYPTFLGETFISLKETETAVFYLGAVWAFWHWLKSNNRWWQWLIIFYVFVTLSFGVKWNIIFLPAALIPWLFLIRKTEAFYRWYKVRRLVWALPFSVIAILGFVIILSPYGWSEPISTLFNISNYYQRIGVGLDDFRPAGFDLPLGIDAYPISLLVAQAPLITLALALLGLGVIFLRKLEDGLSTGWLVVFWLTVPLIRIIVPGFKIYGATRQIKEFIPAVAMMAAFGAVWLLSKLSPKAKLGGGLIILLLYGGLMLTLGRLHPNENVYFNLIAGGVKGAVFNNLIDRQITYGNIYKQAAQWLNKNVEQNSKIAFLNASMFSLSPLFLRDDISISPEFFSSFDRKGEYILELYSAFDRPFFARRYLFRFLNPIHTIDVDGAPILYIFKNSPEFLKPDFANEEKTTDFEVKMVTDSVQDFLEISLRKSLKVSRIELRDISPQCAQPDFHNSAELIYFSTEKEVMNEDRNILSASDRKYLGTGKTEIYFPAQQTRKIKIVPISVLSCFVRGKITSISYLKENQ